MLDYTTLLLDEVPYGQRKGTWEFVLRPVARCSSVNYLHGVRHIIILKDAPAFPYVVRHTVNTWKSEPQYSCITIDYDLDPFRYSISASDDKDWLRNNVFVDLIRYRTFTMPGSMIGILSTRDYCLLFRPLPAPTRCP